MRKRPTKVYSRHIMRILKEFEWFETDGRGARGRWSRAKIDKIFDRYFEFLDEMEKVEMMGQDFFQNLFG